MNLNILKREIDKRTFWTLKELNRWVDKPTDLQGSPVEIISIETITNRALNDCYCVWFYKYVFDLESPPKREGHADLDTGFEDLVVVGAEVAQEDNDAPAE